MGYPNLRRDFLQKAGITAVLYGVATGVIAHWAREGVEAGKDRLSMAVYSCAQKKDWAGCFFVPGSWLGTEMARSTPKP